MGGVSDEIKLSTRGIMAWPVSQHPLSLTQFWDICVAAAGVLQASSLGSSP